MYYFIPRDTELEGEYSLFWSVKNVFMIKSVGIITGSDPLYINKNRNDLIRKLQNMNIQINNNLIKKITYRPYDVRYIYYDTKLIVRPGYKVMQHMLKDNISLITTRQLSSQFFKHILVSTFITESCYCSNKTKEINYVYPLYLHSDKDEHLFAEEKEVNFSLEFKKYWKSELKEFSEEDIFYYIYALLFSNNYRKRYNEFLKTDFPRIDFSFMKTKGTELINFGKQLIDLHLIKADILNKQEDWKISVNGKERAIKYNLNADIYKDNKIYLNPNCFIEPIEPEAFNFMIGGYKVLEKFITDLKGETLELDDLMHYLRIIVIVKKTIGLMIKIDELVTY